MKLDEHHIQSTFAPYAVFKPIQWAKGLNKEANVIKCTIYFKQCEQYIV